MWEQLEKERKGISVSHGIIHYPKQKKLLEVELTEQDIDLIQDAIRKMEDIVRMDASPKVINKPYCKKCAYWEYCYGLDLLHNIKRNAERGRKHHNV